MRVNRIQWRTRKVLRINLYDYDDLKDEINQTSDHQKVRNHVSVWNHGYIRTTV